MQTLTLASIYELQGLKEEALEVYKDLLKKIQIIKMHYLLLGVYLEIEKNLMV